MAQKKTINKRKEDKGPSARTFAKTLLPKALGGTQWFKFTGNRIRKQEVLQKSFRTVSRDNTIDAKRLRSSAELKKFLRVRSEDRVQITPPNITVSTKRRVVNLATESMSPHRHIKHLVEQKRLIGRASAHSSDMSPFTRTALLTRSYFLIEATNANGEGARYFVFERNKNLELFDKLLTDLQRYWKDKR